MRKNLIAKAASKARILSGICFNQVFQGPYEVYVNLTNHCNLNCLMCSVYSPLVGDKRGGDKSGFLKREILDKLVDSFISLGVRLVTVTGGGEPFLHPHLMTFVGRLADAGKDMTIVTNGTVIREDQITDLLGKNVNLRFSLIAASPKTYVEVHPNQTAATFDRVTTTLALIRDCRKRSKSRSTVSILFVIFKNNFQEIPRMLALGREYEADFVHFKPAIFDHDEMSELFLDEAQLHALDDIIRSARSAPDVPFTDITNMRNELEQNQQRIVSPGKSGQRRTIPCYKGWTFCWILANGDVVPCCDCSVPLGNINDKPFEQIWHSSNYSAMRKGMTTLNQGCISLPGCRCDTCRPSTEEVNIAKGLRLLGRGSTDNPE